jgi:glutamate-ammonia-ligase adenylyltransferase
MQLLQMRHAGANPGLRTPQTLAALTAAVKAGLIDSADGEILAAAWRTASRLRNAAMLVRGRASDSLPGLPRDRRGVAFLCGYGADGSSHLLDHYQRTTRRAAAVVERVFWTE